MPEQPNLERKLSLFSVTNIVIANMIGVGIFTTSGLLMADLHSPSLMMTLWVFGGLIALAGALCYGEVGAAIPKAGGEYAFLSQLYNPLLGFLSGWISFLVGFSAPIAASSVGFSEYLSRALPGLFQWGSIDVAITKKIFSILIILVFTFIHIQGIKFGSKVQNYLTVLKIALLVVLVIFGFSLGNGDIGHLVSNEPSSLDFGGWKTIALALMWISFSYSGWNASTYIGSEIKDPKRNLPRSLLIGTGVVILLYLLLNTLFVYAIPAQEMKGVIAIGGLAVKNMFGESADQLFSLLISFALFSSISAFIILGPRVYYAMAVNGHFFKFARKVSARHKVPSSSILFQAAIAIILVLVGTLDQIFTYMGFALSIFPILVAFSVFKLRKTNQSVLKLPGYPWIPAFFILTGLILHVLAYFERPVESSIAVLTVLIGIPFYYVFRKEKAHP
jgi:APA family basic amino acid/polyamine antiporter